MEPLLPISYLNDFLFCPASIYYHGLIQGSDGMMSSSIYQIRGISAHRSIEEGTYSSRKNVLTGKEVCSQNYGLSGKIDVFDMGTGTLMERKKHVTQLYDGFVFQLYAQCVCLREMGYDVRRLCVHSLDDNRNYDVSLPENDPGMFQRFLELLDDIRTFDIGDLQKQDVSRCSKCIYSMMCGICDIDDLSFRFHEKADSDGLLQ